MKATRRTILITSLVAVLLTVGFAGPDWVSKVAYAVEAGRAEAEEPTHDRRERAGIDGVSGPVRTGEGLPDEPEEIEQPDAARQHEVDHQPARELRARGRISYPLSSSSPCLMVPASMSRLRAMADSRRCPQAVHPRGPVCQTGIPAPAARPAAGGDWPARCAPPLLQ